MWREFKEIKSDKKTLGEFGLTIGAILVILGDIALWRGRPSYLYLLGPGFFLMGLGVLAPAVLKPIQKIWMGLSIVLGFFMSRVLLVLLFYAVITPIGLIMKLFGKDVLQRRIDRERTSYWIDRPRAKRDMDSYENQY